MNTDPCGISNCAVHFDNSLMLNLAKGEFGKAVVTHISKQVGQGQILQVAAKVQAIVDFPATQTQWIDS